jgi:hypothetical protein
MRVLVMAVLSLFLQSWVDAEDTPDFKDTLMAYVDSRSRILSFDFEYTCAWGKKSSKEWSVELNGRYARDSRIDSS